MRCRVGDRAVIVGGFRDNIGHLVNVDRAHPSRIGWWVVEVLGNCIGRYPGDDFQIIPAGRIGAIRDLNLWPLRNEPDTKETRCLNVTSEKR